jgi:hypothetical protein
MPYLKNSLPDELMLSALFEFCPGWLSEAIDKELIFEQLFIPWMLFNWVPDKDSEIGQFDPQKQ